MDILKIVLMILFAIDCIALTAIVLMQEGKSAGLGAISGIAGYLLGSEQRSFNGRSTCKVYKVPLRFCFVVLAVVLNLKVFA